eukprot:gene18333-25816_t
MRSNCHRAPMPPTPAHGVAQHVQAQVQQLFRRDIAEMDAMIASTLDYLRGVAGAEAWVHLDVQALVDSMADDQVAMGHTVTVAGQAAPLRVQAVALRQFTRLFERLGLPALREVGDVQAALQVGDLAGQEGLGGVGAGIVHLGHVLVGRKEGGQPGLLQRDGPGLGQVVGPAGSPILAQDEPRPVERTDQDPGGLHVAALGRLDLHRTPLLPHRGGREGGDQRDGQRLDQLSRRGGLLIEGLLEHRHRHGALHAAWRGRRGIRNGGAGDGVHGSAFDRVTRCSGCRIWRDAAAGSLREGGAVLHTTRLEEHTSDWRYDVCSSDLVVCSTAPPRRHGPP